MAGFRIAPWTLTVMLIGLGWPAAAQAPARPKRVTRAEFDRLAQEVERQRLVLEQIVRLQQEHVRALTEVLGGNAPVPAPAPAPTTTTPPPPPLKRKPGEETPPPPKPTDAKGSIIGKVVVRGGSADNAWVYLDSGETATSNQTVSMAQRGKQFVPRILVVQKGTRVDFPNLDPDFHNVFSLSPGNAFDLGTYKQGQSKSVVMQQPGVVSVYCNRHTEMVGFVLVVPGRIYSAVGKDGFFHLDNVPPGKHKLVAWAPNAAAVTKEVIVGEGAASADLTLTVAEQKPHLRKDGTPYGSYNE